MRIDRCLTRLWWALTVPPVLALAVQLGTALGARSRPSPVVAPVQSADIIHRGDGTSSRLIRRGVTAAVTP